MPIERVKVLCNGIVGMPKSIGRYDIYECRFSDFLNKKNRTLGLNRLISAGLNGYYKSNCVRSAACIDRLYREKDAAYLEYIEYIEKNFSDSDIFISFNNNNIHPEVLEEVFSEANKVIGMVDSPVSTYSVDIPYLWSFDAAAYITPSYNGSMLMREALAKWGMKQSYWLPLTQPFEKVDVDNRNYDEREIDVVYIGKPYREKINRLKYIKDRFGDDFVIKGRWPYKGFYGFLAPIVGGEFFPHVINPVTEDERKTLYLNSKIGFNMHYSVSPMETGNMRMYEVPAYGAMLVCDKAAKNAHNLIYKDGEEAVYYDDIRQAADIIHYYINNPQERMGIAMSGHKKFWAEYSFEENIEKFLDWALEL